MLESENQDRYNPKRISEKFRHEIADMIDSPINLESQTKPEENKDPSQKLKEIFHAKKITDKFFYGPLFRGRVDADWNSPLNRSLSKNMPWDKEVLPIILKRLEQAKHEGRRLRVLEVGAGTTYCQSSDHGGPWLSRFLASEYKNEIECVASDGLDYQDKKELIYVDEDGSLLSWELNSGMLANPNLKISDVLVSEPVKKDGKLVEFTPIPVKYIRQLLFSRSSWWIYHNNKELPVFIKNRDKPCSKRDEYKQLSLKDLKQIEKMRGSFFYIRPKIDRDLEREVFNLEFIPGLAIRETQERYAQKLGNRKFDFIFGLYIPRADSGDELKKHVLKKGGEIYIHDPMRAEGEKDSRGIYHSHYYN